MPPSVIHVTLSKFLSAGIVNQLRDEVHAVDRLRLPWRTVLLTTGTVNEPFAVKLPVGMSSLASRIQALHWLLKRYRRFDVLLLRHDRVEPLLWTVSRRFPCWISVHHTKEIEECRLIHPRWRALACSTIERHFGTMSIRSATGIIGVTDEIVAYELARVRKHIPSLTVPNGIDIQRIPLVRDLRGGIPKLLFVASQFSDWQGLDLVLDTLEKSSIECQLILVGRLDGSWRRRIRSSPRLRSTVVLFGHADRVEILDLMATADIGLSSFGLARKGMKEACTLKVREYLGGGLPVYAGHQDTGLPVGFPFFRNGSPNIDTIIQQGLQWRNYTRREVRAAAIPWIDKTCLLSRLYSWLCSEFWRQKDSVPFQSPGGD